MAGGACVQWGHVWQKGVCVVGGMCGRGPCVMGCVWQGGVHGRGHAWQRGTCVPEEVCTARRRGMCGRGHVWQGHGRGDMHGTHPPPADTTRYGQ